MGGFNPPKRRKVLVTLVYLAAVLVMAATDSAEPTVLLDWSEWNGQPAVPLSERRQYTDTNSGTALGAHCLRRLVRECSVRLEVPGRQCGDVMIERDDYRVPFFYSRPSCGFEVRFV